MSDAIFKKLTVEELERDEILVSVDSLKNYVASRNLDGAGLHELLCELLVAGQGNMVSPKSSETIRSFFGRYANAINAAAPEVAHRMNMPIFEEHRVSKEVMDADIRFFQDAIVNGGQDWKEAAEKRLDAARLERLKEITTEVPREIGPAEQRQIDYALRRRGEVTAF